MFIILFVNAVLQSPFVFLSQLMFNIRQPCLTSWFFKVISVMEFVRATNRPSETTSTPASEQFHCSCVSVQSAGNEISKLKRSKQSDKGIILMQTTALSGSKDFTP